MELDVKVPQRLCRRLQPTHPFAEVETYEFKQEVLDWFAEMDGTYNLRHFTFYHGSDMVVDIVASMKDLALATQFKLRWL
jgi:hypothetical protein